MAMVCLSAIGLSMSKTGSRLSDATLTSVEALADCESVNGYENDGHCVHDRVNNYFCKTPKFLQSRDCRQSTTVIQ